MNAPKEAEYVIRGRFYRRIANNSMQVYKNGKWIKSNMGVKAMHVIRENAPGSVKRLNKPESKRIEPKNEYEDC